MKVFARRFFSILLLCSLSLLLCQCESHSQSTKSKPNILFIFADDLAYEAVGCYGNDEVKTPAIDSLAKTGVTFTHAYNMGSWSGAVCVASRNMLNTGRYVWNARMNASKDSFKEDAANKVLWSQRMKAAGYTTYFTGKWHVPIEPSEIFDHAKNVRGGMPRQTKAGYDRPHVGKKDLWSPYDPQHGGFWKGGKHWSEVLGDDSISFIEMAAKDDKPFFMYLAFNAPHDPRQAPKKYVDMYPSKKIKIPQNYLALYPEKDHIGCGKSLRDERLAPFPRTHHAVQVNRQEYYAIITHMDDQIARIIKALKKSGMYDNTLIIFSADHGLACGYHGLLGKQNMYDHSVRVPLIFSGLGLKASKIISTPVYFQDLMPTTLSYAGADKAKQMEFLNLRDHLEGKKTATLRDATYGAYLSLQRMITMGNYKLIYYPRVKKTKVFNLKKDSLEMNDLAQDPQYKTKVEELMNKLKEWQKKMNDRLEID